MRGLRQGRRSSSESQEVLSRRALGNVPPMPVTHEARKWRKSGISLGSPLVSFVIPAINAEYPVTLEKFLDTLGCAL